MGWRRLSMAAWNTVLGHEEAEVDLGRLGEVAFLRRYMIRADEKLAPAELGRRIDDGLVEYIRMELCVLKICALSVEGFKSRMSRIEEGMRENLALNAFAATLRKSDNVPLASGTYLKLARRDALSGGKRPPSYEEGRQFARVVLAPFMREAFWETRWDIRSFARVGAVNWLNRRDPDVLRELIDESEESPVAWDTLLLICQGLAGRREEELPYELLKWHLMANHGHPERPDEGPAPPHRPTKLGYKLRNNEIRHAVDLLAQVAMPKTAGRQAVAEAFNLSSSTIQTICRKPNLTTKEFALDAMRTIQPSYASLRYGSDSNSGPSSSV